MSQSKKSSNGTWKVGNMQLKPRNPFVPASMKKKAGKQFRAKVISNETLSYFEYDESSKTGLRWTKDIWAGNKKVAWVGKEAGYLTKAGYYRVVVNRGAYLVHRLIIGLLYPDFNQELFVDHIDGNRSNNHRSNLRLVDHNLNMKNNARKPGPSGIKGVRKTCIRGVDYWKGELTINGETISKHFSIKEFGEEVAFKLAAEFREKLLKLHPEFTDRHIGKQPVEELF